MGNYTQLIGTLTGAFGKFEQDKSNLIILVLFYLGSSLIVQLVFVCQISLVISKIKSNALFIKFAGYWHSDAMLCYLHIQSCPIMSGLS
jgi:hypothetical protein